ncbi:alkaline phosphatase family protein [Peribacillus sp. SCS-155]|uniref:alkaline phosphatase family protein n=1 Tax=Peribacillus sedimenti TaxID=3115297 RepID=UPI003905A67C
MRFARSVTIIILILLSCLRFFKFLVHRNKLIDINHVSTDKKVVLIVMDSIMDAPLQLALKEGKLPALQFLLQKGRYYPDMVSSYPTMSVCVDSSLLTGKYPDKHKVPALVWYNEKQKRFISYGSDKKEIFKLGPKRVLHESLFHLNLDHLRDDLKTIHEELHDRGLQSASINTLVYRGYTRHRLTVPILLKTFRFLPPVAFVRAPAYFSYGMLCKLNPRNKHTRLWEGFGFNDKFAAKEFEYLIEHNRVPSFSIVYFSDNDKKVHKEGVLQTKGLEADDLLLQSILNKYESWDQALDDTIWIVMGDSGQTAVIKDKDEALIDLRKLLNEYKIHRITGPIQEQDQIVLGLNERMCFIYILDPAVKLETIANILQQDGRIDIIAWKEERTVNVISGGKNGIFSFTPGGEYVDEYGQQWEINGELDLLNLKLEGDGRIVFGDYPDALARLYSSFYSHEGNYLAVNAYPGFEFVGEGSPTHTGGGSHGSLHKQDSFFPLIVAGTDLEPKHRRIIDLKEWIMKILE